MKTIFKQLTLLTTAVAFAGSAYAVPTLRISDGVTTVTVTDGGVGDSNALPGVVTYIGAVGANWMLNVTTGVSKPFLGSATQPHMDLNSVNATSLGAGTLTILFSDDFFGPTSGTFTAAVGGTAAGTVQFSTFADPGNALFATTLALTSTGAMGPGAFSNTSTANRTLGAPYSLTERAIITHTGAGQNSSFDADLSAAPDAGTTLILLGSSVSALGFFARNRKRSAKA